MLPTSLGPELPVEVTSQVRIPELVRQGRREELGLSFVCHGQFHFFTTFIGPRVPR